MAAAKRPPWLLALGRQAPPEEVQLGQAIYRLEEVFKHDFFAFTGRYGGPEGRVVVKLGRSASFFGFPLAWVGRLLARRERQVFERLAGLEVVPAFTGAVGANGISHSFVDGAVLRRGAPGVPDDFFARLRTGVDSIHARGVAIVDLEKPENVLLGEDGRPYLFDFQISHYGSPQRPGWLLNYLQDADHYHVLKLQRRVRPDQLDAETLRSARRRPRLIQLYGKLTRPIIRLRRRCLARVYSRRQNSSA